MGGELFFWRRDRGEQAWEAEGEGSGSFVE